MESYFSYCVKDQKMESTLWIWVVTHLGFARHIGQYNMKVGNQNHWPLVFKPRTRSIDYPMNQSRDYPYRPVVWNTIQDERNWGNVLHLSFKNSFLCKENMEPIENICSVGHDVQKGWPMPSKINWFILSTNIVISSQFTWSSCSTSLMACFSCFFSDSLKFEKC